MTPCTSAVFCFAGLLEEGAAEGGGFVFRLGIHREAGGLRGGDGRGCGKPAGRAFAQQRTVPGVKAFLKVVETGTDAEDVCPAPPKMDKERAYSGKRGVFERVKAFFHGLEGLVETAADSGQYGFGNLVGSHRPFVHFAEAGPPVLPCRHRLEPL